MTDRFPAQIPASPHSRRLLNCLAVVVIATAISFNSNLDAALVESYNGDYVVVIDATGSEYIQIFDLLYYDFSFELVWINIEAFEPTETWDGGPPTKSPYLTYSAVFEQVPDNSQMVHQLGLNKTEVMDSADIIKANNGELMQIEAYTNLGGETRYAYIAKMNTGASPNWDLKVDLSNDLYLNIKDDFDQVVNLCRTINNGQQRLAVLFKDDNSDTVAFDSPMSLNDLVSQRSLLEPQGYRVTSIEVVNSYTQEPRYIPIFKKNGNLSFTYEKRVAGDPPSQVADFNENEANGMAPVLIAAENFSFQSGWGAFPFFRANWRSRARINRDLDPIAKPAGDTYTPDSNDWSEEPNREKSTLLSR